MELNRNNGDGGAFEVNPSLISSITGGEETVFPQATAPSAGTFTYYRNDGDKATLSTGQEIGLYNKPGCVLLPLHFQEFPPSQKFVEVLRGALLQYVFLRDVEKTVKDPREHPSLPEKARIDGFQESGQFVLSMAANALRGWLQTVNGMNETAAIHAITDAPTVSSIALHIVRMPDYPDVPGMPYTQEQMDSGFFNNLRLSFSNQDDPRARAAIEKTGGLEAAINAAIVSAQNNLCCLGMVDGVDPETYECQCEQCVQERAGRKTEKQKMREEFMQDVREALRQVLDERDAANLLRLTSEIDADDAAMRILSEEDRKTQALAPRSVFFRWVASLLNRKGNGNAGS